MTNNVLLQKICSLMRAAMLCLLRNCRFHYLKEEEAPYFKLNAIPEHTIRRDSTKRFYKHEPF